MSTSRITARKRFVSLTRTSNLFYERTTQGNIMQKKIGIVIVNYNDYKTTKHLLENIKKILKRLEEKG